MHRYLNILDIASQISEMIPFRYRGAPLRDFVFKNTNK